ncbi:MAG: ankyrin repeat domain-containing protein [bacterium]
MRPRRRSPDETGRPRPATPRPVISLTLLALGLAAGCAAPRTVGEYLGDRVRDAADCVRLSAGYGLGLHARAHLLRLPAIGYGTAPHVRKFGWDGPAGAGALAWDETAGSVFLPPLLWADADGRSPDMARVLESRTAPAGAPRDARRVWHLTALGLLWPESTDRRMYFRTIPPGTQWADAWWLGADATIGYPSVRIGVNPVEIADLLLGFAGLDILGDDHWAAETEPARAMIEAARAGNAAEVRSLLRSNSRLVYARDAAHATPLYHAAAAGHLDVVRALIERGAHLDARLKDEDLTPVHAAARAGNRHVFQELLEAGARPDLPGLLRAAASGGDPAVVAAAFPHADDDAHRDALRAAVRFGRVRAARRLAELGVPLTTRSRLYHGFLRGTLLHSAAKAGHPRMIEFLVERGLDVNARDAHDMTAAARRLQPAVWDKGRQHVRWVLGRAAADRQAPLHLAARAGLIDAVKTLLEHGARPDARDGRGRTPLFRAARAGRTKTARALIAARADPAVTDEDGTAPLHLAAASGRPETVELLLEHGADPRARRETDGDTPLHRAALRGRVWPGLGIPGHPGPA